MRIDMKRENNNPATSMLDQIRKEMERRKPGSIDEANLIAKELSRTYNNTVQPDMGGVSPEQAFILTQPGWLDRALTLNDRLTLEDLAEVGQFHNVRRLLLAVRGEGVVKATATGAFNRKFAMRMFDEFIMNSLTREFALRHNKVFNQNDVPYLELLRHLLPIAGLLLFRKGEFRLTKQANALLNENAAVELYTQMFRTILLKYNIGALDGLPDAPQIQATIGFAIYQLSKRAGDWIEVADIAPHLFLPAVLDSLPPFRRSESSVDLYADIRILKPLNGLGLVEYEDESAWRSSGRIRKTALFDRFIQFNLPQAVG